jgi:hypothetical protein
MICLLGIVLIALGVMGWKKVNKLSGTDAVNVGAKLGMKWLLILLFFGGGGVITLIGVGSILAH